MSHDLKPLGDALATRERLYCTKCGAATHAGLVLTSPCPGNTPPAPRPEPFEPPLRPTMATSALPHTCYLIAFLYVDTLEVAVREFGVFSEPEPTVNRSYITARIWETHGKDYQEALDEMKADVNHFAEILPFWKVVLTWFEKNPSAW